MLGLLVFGPMAGAVASYLFGKFNKTLRNYVAGAITLAEFALLAYFCISVVSGNSIEFRITDIVGMGMYFKLDGFRVLYGLVASFMWLCTTLFAPEYFAHYRNRNRYYFFVLMTLGATVGVFLSADLFTTFICFEIMSFTSYVWVAQEEKADALRAAETYLAVAVIGGMVMLMGLFLLYYTAGTLEIDALYQACEKVADKTTLYIAGGCILFGFGAKAGMFPLHIWLPKAHPVAPAPASALLSGILTKTGIYGILAISCNIFRHDKAWGTVIFTLGVITMFLGAFIAVFSINLKRTLACSSMSQIGFILVGIGMQGLLGEENALAVRGTILHMVNHSMIKLILFMAAGVVYFNIHKLELNDIKGFGRGKKLLTACFGIGALSISGMPLFSGYVSKTLLHESIVEYANEISVLSTYSAIKTAEWIFLVTGGMTFAYMLKLFICVFVEKNNSNELQLKYSNINKKYMKPLTALVLAVPSVVLFVMGVLPYKIMNPIAHLALDFMAGEEPIEAVNYFSVGNLKGGAISLSIGLIVYLLIIRLLLVKKTESGPIYINAWPDWLDLENLIYRPLVQHIIPFVLALVLRCFDKVTDGLIVLCRITILKEAKPPKVYEYGNSITTSVGQVLNFVRDILNKTIRRKNIDTKDYVLEMAINWNASIKAQRIAAKSISYGLILFGIGFIITIAYLMFNMVIYKL